MERVQARQRERDRQRSEQNGTRARSASATNHQAEREDLRQTEEARSAAAILTMAIYVLWLCSLSPCSPWLCSLWLPYGYSHSLWPCSLCLYKVQELSASTTHATCLKDRPQRESRALDLRRERRAQQPRPAPIPEGAHWSRLQAIVREARPLGGFSAVAAGDSLQAPPLPAPRLQLSGDRKATAASAAAEASAAREAASLAMAADLEAAEAAGAGVGVAAVDISIYLEEGATDFEQSAGLATPAEGWPELVSPQPVMSSYLSDGDGSIERAPTSPSPVGPTSMEV